MREKSKDRGISLGRKLISLVANEYGYKGRVVAKYLRKDPAIITRYHYCPVKIEYPGEVPPLLF